MRLAFKIGDGEALLERNWWTGRISLTVAETRTTLASPWNPLTHISLKLTRTWKVETPGHQIEIEKKRPILFAGLREHSYRVFVDGQIVAQTSGY